MNMMMISTKKKKKKKKNIFTHLGLYPNCNSGIALQLLDGMTKWEWLKFYKIEVAFGQLPELFLTEVGALLVLDNDNTSLSLNDVYKKVSEGTNRCLWEQFEVYRHLKSLGFIVGKHKVPWSVKGVKSESECVSSQSSIENNGASDLESKDNKSISELLNTLQLDEVRPIFDVYLPNSKFKKSSPGDPSFMVCLTRGYPPSKEEIKILERKFGGIPMKYCHIEYGRVCFFSFDKVELPVLP